MWLSTYARTCIQKLNMNPRTKWLWNSKFENSFLCSLSARYYHHPRSLCSMKSTQKCRETQEKIAVKSVARLVEIQMRLGYHFYHRRSLLFNSSISIQDRQRWHITSTLSNGHQEQSWTLTPTPVCLILQQIHRQPSTRVPSKQAKIAQSMRVIRSFWVIYRHQQRHNRFRIYFLTLKWAMLR